MKRVTVLLGAILVFLMPVSASSQQAVEVYDIDGAYDKCNIPKLIDGAFITFYLRAANFNASACAYDPTLTFRIYSPDGAIWIGLGIDTVVGASALFDAASYWQGTLTGSVADTVSISLLSGDRPGLTDGSDEILVALSFLIIEGNEGSICIDTASVSGGFDWSWTGLSGCNDIIPDWGGPYCYRIDMPHGMPTLWFDPPAQIQGYRCEPMAFDFDVSDPGPNDITFDLIQGPGTIDPGTGVWSWDGVSGMADAGDTILIVSATEAGNCIGTPRTEVDTITLLISNETNLAPYFSIGCRAVRMAPRGVESSLTLTGIDNCPLDEVTAEFILTDAVGVVTIDGTTVNFTPDLADSGTITVRVVATDGIDVADEWCEIYFSVMECDGCTSCCGIYTGGYTGNLNMSEGGKRTLADLTKMIDHVYISKAPLLCPSNANTDGDPEGKINLADITRFIDMIYISKQNTAPCQ